MDHVKHLKCLICGKEYAPDEVDYVCPDHGNEGILDVRYDYGLIGQRISRGLHEEQDRPHEDQTCGGEYDRDGEQKGHGLTGGPAQAAEVAGSAVLRHEGHAASAEAHCNSDADEDNMHGHGGGNQGGHSEFAQPEGVNEVVYVVQERREHRRPGHLEKPSRDRSLCEVESCRYLSHAVGLRAG